MGLQKQLGHYLAAGHQVLGAPLFLPFWRERGVVHRLGESQIHKHLVGQRGHPGKHSVSLFLTHGHRNGLCAPSQTPRGPSQLMSMLCAQRSAHSPQAGL